MAATTLGTRVKDIVCQEHGGTFSIPVTRGRNPRVCGGKHPACGGRPKASNARTARETSRTGEDTPRTRTAALKATGSRVGRRERVAVVIGEDDMRPMAERVRKESRSARTGWCSCKTGGPNHERGTGKCRYNKPDPTTTAKALPKFSAYFPARMKSEWVILHAEGCDHTKASRRVDIVELDLFADDMSENLSKLDVDGLGYDWNGVGISNCALNHAKRHRTATQRAAREAAPLTKAVNPCIPLAHKAKGMLEPLGWAVKGRAAFRTESGTTGDERDVPFAEVTATRGTETLVITWWEDVNGEIQSSQDYSLWSVDKPSENEKPLRPKKDDKPKHRLPFNPALITNEDLIREIIGRKVIWWNALRKGEESGEISPTKIQVESVYNGSGHELPSERIIKFLDPGKTGGFRAFHLSALLAVR